MPANEEAASPRPAASERRRAVRRSGVCAPGSVLARQLCVLCLALQGDCCPWGSVVHPAFPSSTSRRLPFPLVLEQRSPPKMFPQVSCVWKLIGLWGACTDQQMRPSMCSAAQCAVGGGAWLEVVAGVRSGKCILVPNPPPPTPHPLPLPSPYPPSCSSSPSPIPAFVVG